MSHREGFACAGAWFLERVKIVTQFPGAGQETIILNEYTRPGGCAFETLSHLRHGDNDLPLYALGLLGEDEDGRAILSACQKQEIDTFQLQAATTTTAGAIVIQTETEAPATRLVALGANTSLGAEHFDFRHCLARWLHLSDLHLLAKLRQPDENWSSAAGRILQMARASEMICALTWTAANAAEILSPLLSLVDYLVIDAQTFASLTSCDFCMDSSSRENVYRAAGELFRAGLSHGLAIRFAEGAYGQLCTEERAWVPYFAGRIPSAAAFSAGFLRGRYAGEPLESCLVAACKNNLP